MIPILDFGQRFDCVIIKNAGASSERTVTHFWRKGNHLQTKRVRNFFVVIFFNCFLFSWAIRGKAKDQEGRAVLTFELEVVYVESLKMVGIRRKRLNGPSFMYKKICEDILSLAGV